MHKVKYNNEDKADHFGVAAIIKNDQGEILMQKHIKFGFWTIPVGKVKTGQSLESGLAQELLEECNIIPEKSKELAAKTFTYLRDGHEVKVTSHLFEVLKYKGEIKNNEPEKHEQQIFLSLNKIKKAAYLSDMTLLYLETLGIKREAKI